MRKNKVIYRITFRFLRKNLKHNGCEKIIAKFICDLRKEMISFVSQ
jgi:hypothetical protein